MIMGPALCNLHYSYNRIVSLFSKKERKRNKGKYAKCSKYDLVIRRLN